MTQVSVWYNLLFENLPVVRRGMSEYRGSCCFQGARLQMPPFLRLSFLPCTSEPTTQQLPPNHENDIWLAYDTQCERETFWICSMLSNLRGFYIHGVKILEILARGCGGR